MRLPIGDQYPISHRLATIQTDGRTTTVLKAQPLLKYGRLKSLKLTVQKKQN